MPQCKKKQMTFSRGLIVSLYLLTSVSEWIRRITAIGPNYPGNEVSGDAEYLVLN